VANEYTFRHITSMTFTLRKRFGSKIRELRLGQGMSQETFADLCGFARSYMSRLERGEGNPSLDAIEVLANSLGVDAQVLFEPMIRPPMSVPFAADGTCFHPGLIRPQAQTYAVGNKGAGNTYFFKTFDEALEYLRNMPTARWWRPISKGKWGLVTAVRWGALPGDLTAGR